MRIIDSHAHIGDIFHESKNITFKTNLKKGDYDDPFIACERSGYTTPLFPPDVLADPEKAGPFLTSLIKSGQYRCWEWSLENLSEALDEHPEVKYYVGLPIWPNQTFEEYWAASLLDDRVIPFTTCVLDMDIADMCNKLRRDIERGAKGLKLHPTIQNCPLDDPRIEAAMRVFAEADLPVLTHCGTNSYYTEDDPHFRDQNPAFSDFQSQIVPWCHKWCDQPLIVAHSASVCEILYEGVKDLDNVWTDTSMCSAELMRKAVDLLGADKVLFGTDAPFGSFHYSVKALIDAFGDDLETLDKVGFTNFATLIHMPYDRTVR